MIPAFNITIRCHEEQVRRIPPQAPLHQPHQTVAIFLNQKFYDHLFETGFSGRQWADELEEELHIPQWSQARPLKEMVILEWSEPAEKTKGAGWSRGIGSSSTQRI